MTEGIPFQLKLVQIDNPEGLNFILGQSHFIKTVEDIHEVVVTGVPSARFGLAFCESSGLALVRSSGTDENLKGLAERNALALGAGHCFILFLRDAYPINVLNAIKMVPEVANIYCASANPVQVILAETEQGRGILGVIDGIHTEGVEGPDGVAWRTGFLRKIGYKIG
jgi:adenosine/AMP kinase